MPIPILIVDAFTDKPFAGNPAAVCCLQQDLPVELKQKIAAEMNLSETAYVTLLPESADFSSGTRFGLKWFTPTNEVPLCGHATLASAAVIFHKHGNKAKTIEFETLSGTLKASQTEDLGIVLDFPINDPSPYNADLLALLKVTTGDLIIKDIQLSSTTRKLLLRLDDQYTRKDLEKLSPNTDQLGKIDYCGVIRGVIITLRAGENEGYDFYSRYFAPWFGIPEDPVTGSAHTVLAPYWQKVYSKNRFRARQCSKRGGDLDIEIVGQRVEMTGKVAHVVEGVLNIE